MNLALQLLGALGFGGILATIINAMFNKRKLSAEATEVITKAASGVVERLEKENQRIIAREEVNAQRAAADHQEIHQLRTLISMHAYWDQQAYEALQAQGINLPKPPPLTTNPAN